MSKPYLDVDLSAQLTADRTWRIREISDLKFAVLKADDTAQSSLLRALLAIAYAHWEGAVHFAALKYLEHIALRKLTYARLSPQFTKNLFIPRLGPYAASLGIVQRCEFVDEVLGAAAKRFVRVNENLIHTGGNLNTERILSICTVCDVPNDPYIAEENFIDRLLLKRRNEIAHGQETLVDVADLELLTTKTISLIRCFSDAVENAAVLKSYLRN